MHALHGKALGLRIVGAGTVFYEGDTSIAEMGAR